MEILGLAIVVVLIMLGVLFAVLFVLKSPDSSTEQTYKESQLSSSLVTSMLGTTTACNDATVTELLQDCAVYSRIDCGQTSCDAARDAIQIMLGGTLKEWKRSYRFSITGGGGYTPGEGIQSITDENGDCSGDIESSTNPVPTAGGPLQVTLQLCS